MRHEDLVTMGVRPSWETNLRQMIKKTPEIGAGWSVRGREIGGETRCQVTYRIQEGLGQKNPRSTVFLPLPWNSRNQIEIINALKALKNIYSNSENNCESLKDAEKIRLGPLEKPENSTVNWEIIAKGFLEEKKKQGVRISTYQEYERRVRRFLETMSAKSAPRTGQAVLTKYAKDHLQKMPAGRSGRKRNLGDISALLTYGVDVWHADPKWLPPNTLKSAAARQWQRGIIGADQRQSKDVLTCALYGKTLKLLLDSLEADGKHSLRLVVGLLGIYGLRPAEIATMISVNGEMHVGAIKRNSGSMYKPPAEPRLAIAFNLPELPDEGERLFKLWAEGLLQLPAPVVTAIEKAEATGSFKPVGDAIRQLLERYKYWKFLRKKIPNLVVYSLRHSYAWRGSMELEPPHPLRVIADSMGHELNTHCKHYGRWIDNDELRKAAAKQKNGKSQKVKV